MSICWRIPAIWLAGDRNVMAEKFDPATLPDLMVKERTAYMFNGPTILNAISRIPGIDQRRFPHLKCMLVSAAPISDETALKAYEIFGNAMYQGYGQTEVLPIAMMGPRQWFAKDVPGSQPLPFAELQIWDEDNKPVRPGETVAKCEGRMRGFWNNPEATAERIVDGWVKTGDIGRLDANGYLYMLDRADDMVISGGFNIYPAELESVIAAHPDVVEVAVFGIPDERWGEQVAVNRDPAVRGGVRDGRSVSHGERTGRALRRSPWQLQGAGQGRVASRSAIQDAGRKDSSRTGCTLGTSRAVLGWSGAQGRRQLTTCAARLRE
jgi:acyl-CoA synthetase (AMP-forming)/AMP-acid ligase II